MRNFDLFSSETSVRGKQLDYKDAFLKKFGDQIDSATDDPFYFDGEELVDENGETIRGAKLEEDSWKRLTETLLKHFHIELQ